MRGFGSKTRIVLVGVIALILAGYGWWFLAPAKPAVPDAEIELTSLNLYAGPDDAGELARMPQFDPSGGDWIVEGKHRRSIIALVPPADPNPGADLHGFGRWISVRLADGARRDVMQAAMRALAAEGICTVALFVEGLRANGPEVPAAPVIKIRRVADGHGGMVPCSDRVNPRRS
jgi:hypothetical protein